MKFITIINRASMRKAIKALLRNRRAYRRIRNSCKYLDKYYIEYTYTRSLKRLDGYACDSFSMKINLRLLTTVSLRKTKLHVLKKLIVKKRKNIERINCPDIQ